MNRVKVSSFSVSLDGFGAEPRQDLQNPLGVRGPEIFKWFFETDGMHGQGVRGKGIDNDWTLRAFENVCTRLDLRPFRRSPAKTLRTSL
jgi:hypothetical protein